LRLGIRDDARSDEKRRADNYGLIDASHDRFPLRFWPDIPRI
jgi:hypothetical protein